MRDPDRITPTLAVLERVWRAYPDLRLGQLILATREPHFNPDGSLNDGIHNLYNREDDAMVRKLEQIYG